MVNFIENINSLYDISKNCHLCPHSCGVNRFENEVGFCYAPLHPYVADYLVHFYEESVVSGSNGSGTIFFSRCNMKCLYCQNYEISTELSGQMYVPDALADLMLSMQGKNVHNINLVSPTHNIASIAEAIYIAKGKGLGVPVIYNSGGYESLSTIKLLEGLIDVYMPDFKYADSELSMKLSKARDYPFYAAVAIKKMFEQVGSLKIVNNVVVSGVLIRHLVLPGFIDNSLNVLYLIRDIIKPQKVYINIMDQYHPAYKANTFKKLARRVSLEEYNYIVGKAKTLGFNIVK
jgi:putative pyruvate formate lyase activating enzyme